MFIFPGLILLILTINTQACTQLDPCRIEVDGNEMGDCCDPHTCAPQNNPPYIHNPVPCSEDIIPNYFQHCRVVSEPAEFGCCRFCDEWEVCENLGLWDIVFKDELLGGPFEGPCRCGESWTAGNQPDVGNEEPFTCQPIFRLQERPNAGGLLQEVLKNRARNAKCVLEPNSGDPFTPVQGTISFNQQIASPEVTVTVSLSGFAPNNPGRKHGMHVHTFGKLGNACADAGGHWNPLGVTHGSRDGDRLARHVGDLGNIIEDANGNVDVTFTDSVISLRGIDYDVIGRSIVVHAGEDDLGQGGDAGSLSTGNAGARVGCCVIEEV